MKDHCGDIWQFHGQPGHWIGVTSNHFIKKNGANVMGRGIAFEAAKKFPNLPFEFGESILAAPDASIHVFHDYGLFTFQVKHKWSEDAKLELIEKSCQKLALWMATKPADKFYLARPGCGNGNLKWEDVKPILERYFSTNDNLIVGYK